MGLSHNDNATWIKEEIARWNTIGEINFTGITECDIKVTTAALSNWKSPGVDKIHNFFV